MANRIDHADPEQADALQDQAEDDVRLAVPKIQEVVTVCPEAEQEFDRQWESRNRLRPAYLSDRQSFRTRWVRKP